MRPQNLTLQFRHLMPLWRSRHPCAKEKCTTIGAPVLRPARSSKVLMVKSFQRQCSGHLFGDSWGSAIPGSLQSPQSTLGCSELAVLVDERVRNASFDPLSSRDSLGVCVSFAIPGGERLGSHAGFNSSRVDSFANSNPTACCGCDWQRNLNFHGAGRQAVFLVRQRLHYRRL